MESYDTLLLGSLFGLPAFKEHFGNNYGGKAGYQIAPGWQAGMQQVRHLPDMATASNDLGRQHGIHYRCLAWCRLGRPIRVQVVHPRESCFHDSPHWSHHIRTQQGGSTGR
jgi:hypothetical protein